MKNKTEIKEKQEFRIGPVKDWTARWTGMAAFSLAGLAHLEHEPWAQAIAGIIVGISIVFAGLNLVSER